MKNRVREAVKGSAVTGSAVRLPKYHFGVTVRVVIVPPATTQTEQTQLAAERVCQPQDSVIQGKGGRGGATHKHESWEAMKKSKTWKANPLACIE